jgi:Alr-MurF fusion protein
VLQCRQLNQTKDAMINLDDILRATGGRLAAPAHADTFADFCYDSRIAEPGQLFVAVVTDTGDGHEHTGEACARGATGVLCEHLPKAYTA